MSDADEVTHSSGNVFADLGFAEPETELLKARLAHDILKIIRARRWTEGRAAEALAIDEAQVSAIVRGRLGECSTEHLLHLLTRLDYNVSIDIAPNLAPDRDAQITVLTRIEPALRRAGEPRSIEATPRRARAERSAKGAAGVRTAS